MKRTHLLFGTLALLLFVVPQLAGAQAVNVPFPYFGPLLTCGSHDTALSGPCNNFCDLVVNITAVIYFFLSLVLVFFAPIMIAIGGFLMLTSGGSEERVRKGKATLTAAVVGVAVSLLAYVIVGTVLTFFDTKNESSTGIDVKWGTIQCAVPPMYNLNE